jgi:hypothetical protein
MASIVFSGLLGDAELAIADLQVYECGAVHWWPGWVLQSRACATVDPALYHQHFLGLHDFFPSLVPSGWVSLLLVTACSNPTFL